MLTLLRTWDRCNYSFSYQLRADFTDGTREYNELLLFPKGEPTKEELNLEIEKIKARLEAALLEQKSEPKIEIDYKTENETLKTQVAALTVEKDSLTAEKITATTEKTILETEKAALETANADLERENAALCEEIAALKAAADIGK